MQRGKKLACPWRRHLRAANPTRPPPVALRGELRAALLAGERKIDRWTARFGCAEAAWPAAPHDPFFNANAPEDLVRAEEILQSLPPEAIN
jgi:molybdopterin-guanine dinucleotide biosynthesis protein A